MIAARLALAVLLAIGYQIALNPLIQGLLWVVFGHWQTGIAEVVTWFTLCLVAVLTGVRRTSQFPGLESVPIFTARKFLYLLGDEEQGWTPTFLVDQWPRWVPVWFVAWSCCAWRNKLRNIAFWSALSWLHKPHGELHTYERTYGKLFFRLRTRGWMQEAEYGYGKRFGDFGPRLDFPDQWGGVTWAFRPFGIGK